MRFTWTCGRATLKQSDDKVENEPPAFDEPWQAQVYAMSQVLIDSGKVTPARWAATLGEAIQQQLALGKGDTTETYFIAVSNALETVLAIEDEEVAQVVESWRDAYLTTPHGKPVLISRN